MLRPKYVEVSARVGGFGLKRGYQGKIKLFIPGQECSRSNGRFDLRQPGVTTLFNRLDRNDLPFGGFADTLALIHAGSDTFGQERDDARDAKFGGFLNNGFDDFSFGNGLQQSDPRRRRLDETSRFKRELNLVAIVILDGAKTVAASTVKDGYFFAFSQPKNVQRVMG